MANFTRREMFGLMGGIAGGCAVTALAGPALAADAAKAPAGPEGRFVQTGGDFSWKPKPIDAGTCVDVAHAGFWHKGYGCGYGVLYSIVGLMGEKYGAPYKDFPFSMMEFGKSGISEWGGTCGALLGGAATLALFYPRAKRDAMIFELFRWYETTALPIYAPKPGTTKVEGPLPSSVSDSILCHVSVGKWCAASKFDARSTERSERCARITADVAKKTLEIIQAEMAGAFKPVLQKSEVAEKCTAKGCHGENLKEWKHSGLKGKMDCTPCHTGSNAVQDKRQDHF